jgi:hypothetical protein
VSTDTVSSVLRKIPLRKRLEVTDVTTDLSSAMMLTVRTSFPRARLVNDRFHVQQLISEAVDQLRLRYRWEVLDAENKAIREHREARRAARTKEERELIGAWEPKRMENGETMPQIMARSRHIILKHKSKWNEQQKRRAKILFRLFPRLEQAYGIFLCFALRSPGDDETDFGGNYLVPFGFEFLYFGLHAGGKGGNADAVRGDEVAIGIAQGVAAAQFQHLAFAVFEIVEIYVAMTKGYAYGYLGVVLYGMRHRWQHLAEEIAGGVDEELLFCPGDAHVECTERFGSVSYLEFGWGHEMDRVELAPFGLVDGGDEDGLAVGRDKVFDVGLKEVFFQVDEIDGPVGLLIVVEEAFDCRKAPAGGIVLKGFAFGLAPLFVGQDNAGLGRQLL